LGTIYDYAAATLKGRTVALSDYRGLVLLIVNTASQCGFTPQYEGLEKLHRTFQSRGFCVLGFPCNQFGRQEPGDAQQIEKFCADTYDISFPLFAKIDVNGAAMHPLFEHLKCAKPGIFGTPAIKWNFTKFLVDREGRVAGRFAPTTTPASLESAIAALLEN
jgi:glutathione peroxidase